MQDNSLLVFHVFCFAFGFVTSCYAAHINYAVHFTSPLRRDAQFALFAGIVLMFVAGMI